MVHAVPAEPFFAQIDLGDAHSFSKHEWMQASFSDPCMFHGILFAASSHLEVLRGERDNPITHFHRRHATQLLLEYISSSQRLHHTSIAAAMYLWHYESMNDHVNEAQIHKKGLQQMVKVNGWLKSLGLGGFLPHLITLIDIGDAFLNASKPDFDDRESHQLPETPITLLSAVLRRSEATLCTEGI
ncbi:Fc.00g000580.m01.CDS01 [Cosmosporella sp. VM-42]